ncbi:GNAT family N-acetyltransferase [Haloimpatiens sp. FM7315]|uniref:GNAT family N-acetyltransferase n=1 Tax=Haloimpatiens sp. FM7315 TaxID=3298609 RepID=UPI0035A3BDA5
MFDLRLEFNEVILSSVLKDDLAEVYKWIIKYDNCSEKSCQLNFNEFCNRFLEYYLGEGEVFLKISKGKDIIGILKGRLEFKKNNQLWIRYFRTQSKDIVKGVWDEVIREILNRLANEMGINEFYAIVSSEEKEYLEFWRRNGFKLKRLFDSFDETKNDVKIFIFGKVLANKYKEIL